MLKCCSRLILIPVLVYFFIFSNCSIFNAPYLKYRWTIHTFCIFSLVQIFTNVQLKPCNNNNTLLHQSQSSGQNSWLHHFYSWRFEIHMKLETTLLLLYSQYQITRWKYLRQFSKIFLSEPEPDAGRHKKRLATDNAAPHQR